jgi:hypothetical protein
MKAPPLDVSAASRLAQNVRLRDVVCIGLEAKHLGTPEYRPDQSLAWDIPRMTAIWDLKGEDLKVILPFTVFIDVAEAEVEGQPERKTRVAEIGVVMRLDYSLEKQGESVPSEDDVPDFVGVSGYMHAWPYFRAEVQWLSAKLGFPPLVLPVIVSGHAATQVTVQQLSEIKNTITPKPTQKTVTPKLKKKRTASGQAD